MSTSKEKHDHKERAIVKWSFHILGISVILLVLGYIVYLHIKFTPDKIEPSTIARLNNFKDYEHTRLYSERYLYFEHITADNKYRKGWITNRQDDTIFMESTIYNGGPFTISKATVTTFFVDNNFTVKSESVRDIIGDSKETSLLYPFQKKKVKIQLPKPSCQNCEPIPVVTRISFLGQK